MRRPAPSLVRRPVRVALRLFGALLLSMLLWQSGFVEVFESHDTQAECNDGHEHGACDCAPNCHCCVMCAHQGAAGLPGDELLSAVRLLDFVELGRSTRSATPATAERGPPAKVPKLAS